MAIGKFHGVIIPQTPIGLPHAHGELIGQLRRSGLAEQPPPLARHVIGHVDGFLNVAACFRQHLAHLASHVASEVFLALHEQLRSAEENFGALGSRNQPPVFVSVSCGRHCGVHVLRPGQGKHPDNLIGVRGIAIFEGFAALRTHPFAIDEILENARYSSRCHGSSKTN